jgi:DNA-binding IclR family transcriptional regulator
MVKSADRVIQILETIGNSEKGCTHKELSAALSIPKSSLTSLLNTLVHRGYLASDTDDRRYNLGPQLLVLTGRFLSGLDLVRLGQPILNQLVVEIDESVEIAIRRDHEILVIALADCTRSIKRAIQIGERAPLYATAAGKAILAFLSEDEIQNYLSSITMQSITQHTITDPRILLPQLKAITKGEIAYSHEEFNEGIIAMAAPVFDLNGRVCASIVMPIPVIRFSTDKEKHVGKALRAAGTRLSYLLGFDSNSERRLYSSFRGSGFNV